MNLVLYILDSFINGVNIIIIAYSKLCSLAGTYLMFKLKKAQQNMSGFKHRIEISNNNDQDSAAATA